MMKNILFLFVSVFALAQNPNHQTFLNNNWPTHTPEGIEASRYPISIGTKVMKIFKVIKFTLSFDICYNAVVNHNQKWRKIKT
jgi:hypothetical protein